MAQQRKSGQRKKSTSAKRSAAAKKGAATRKQAARKRSAAAKKGAAKRQAPATDFSAKSVAELREAISKRMLDPLGLVMLSRERIEDAVNDAVKRGRVTTDDAQRLVTEIVERGRKQTNDVLSDLEQLLGRSRDEIEGRTGKARKRGSTAAQRARRQVEDATKKARKEAVKQADPVLARADRARRAAGIGPSFPITGFDDLTAAQVQGRLDGLSPAELRKVRDYERRHANRKSVLSSVEKKLA
jgi:polyhydroxyalkanoate synthesis regulator phasin